MSSGKSFAMIVMLFTYIVQPYAAQRVVNVYVWGGIIPKSVIQSFEASSNIRVNFSSYDSNETLYAKLKASRHGIYDVILPSSYFVERMRNQDMLLPLAHNKLNQLTQLVPEFTNNAYDPNNHYSVPLIWGATGIVYNQDVLSTSPKRWSTLWETGFKEKLLLLDDMREVFAMALISLGYSANDTNPQHIEQAYQRLLALIPNIKLFATEGVQALFIDGDASAGLAWNGDAYKAHAENADIQFVYPQEGFVIWVDCLAIPKNAPHPEAAYAFINYLLRSDIAAQMALEQGHAITNAGGMALLPEAIRTNPMVYPSQEILGRGTFQRDPGEKTIALLNQYWQALKLAL